MTRVELRFPSQRPTASQLLNHRFVKYARKTSSLVDLYNRHQKWKASRPPKSPKQNAGGASPGTTRSAFGSVMSAWEFESAHGGSDEEDGGAVAMGMLGSVSPGFAGTLRKCVMLTRQSRSLDRRTPTSLRCRQERWRQTLRPRLRNG